MPDRGRGIHSGPPALDDCQDDSIVLLLTLWRRRDLSAEFLDVIRDDDTFNLGTPTDRSQGAGEGQTTVTVSKNEVLTGRNQGEKFILTVVLVDGKGHEGPFNIRRPFSQTLDWADVSKTMALGTLLERAESPEGDCLN